MSRPEVGEPWRTEVETYMASPMLPGSGDLAQARLALEILCSPKRYVALFVDEMDQWVLYLQRFRDGWGGGAQASGREVKVWASGSMLGGYGHGALPDGSVGGDVSSARVTPMLVGEQECVWGARLRGSGPCTVTFRGQDGSTVERYTLDCEQWRGPVHRIE